MRILIAAAAIAALAACSQETTTETTPDTTTSEVTTPAPAPSTVIITETDARTRLEGEGYSNVTGLMQNPDGTWSATGTRNGETTQVTVGESGVQVMTTPAPTTGGATTTTP